MDFTIPASTRDLAARVKSFVEREVYPLESLPEDHVHGIPKPALDAVRAKARAEGLFAPQLPKEMGGLGLDLVSLAFVFEEAGRSLVGPLALHCSAPDEGNMHLLHRAATPAQKERYLAPLARGDTRSCFAMTEPAPGAGSDPTMLRTRAVKKGDAWVIDGDKWFTSGADGAAFAIVAAVTDPENVKRGVSLFLVDAKTPGFEVVRQIPVMGHGSPGGHCEVRLRGVTVKDDAVLGGVGDGYKWMQLRLGPARLTHCMRWIGAAQRALEIATARAIERKAFGERLADKQGVQFMLADSEIDLHASRMMTLEAAWKIDQGGEARKETSMCKVFVAEAVNRVVDRAVQIAGSLGYSSDLPLERIFREARAFRIYDGASEVHRSVVARQLIGRRARPLDALAGEPRPEGRTPDDSGEFRVPSDYSSIPPPRAGAHCSVCGVAAEKERLVSGTASPKKGTAAVCAACASKLTTRSARASCDFCLQAADETVRAKEVTICRACVDLALAIFADGEA